MLDVFAEDSIKLNVPRFDGCGQPRNPYEEP